MIGYKLTSANGVNWRDNQSGILPLSPPSMLKEIDQSTAKNILKNHKALFLRWESDFDKADGSPWWHIIKDAPDTLESLPKKTRYMIKRASKIYEAQPLDLQDILEHGYSVYASAYQRYDTHEPILDDKEFCRAVKKMPEQTEWWGIFEKDSHRLVAFSENYTENKTCFYVTMWLEPDAMRKFAGYLLFHQMENHYLEERGFNYISDGARSLSHDTNIHDFLIRKFNFRKAHAHLHVIHTPWLGAAVATAYPFRNWIARISFDPFQKATILLRQEEIRRQCNEVSN